MKIVYAVPGVMPPDEARRRERLLRAWAAPGTQVDVACVEEGPRSIESAYEEYLSIPAAARLIVQKEREGYDAAILGCAGDPGLDAMRELTERMVVVGPGAVSYHAAAMLGYRMGVLTLDEGLYQSCFDLGYKAGVPDRVASVVSADTAVLDLASDRARLLDGIVKKSREAMVRDRVDVLVIGCMTLGFLDVAMELTERLGIPVVNPADTALKAAEMLVSCGLRHSKRAYATPPKIAAGTVKDFSQLLSKKGM